MAQIKTHFKLWGLFMLENQLNKKKSEQELSAFRLRVLVSDIKFYMLLGGTYIKITNCESYSLGFTFSKIVISKKITKTRFVFTYQNELISLSGLSVFQKQYFSNNEKQLNINFKRPRFIQVY